MTMAFSIVIDEIKFREANSRRLRTFFPNFDRCVSRRRPVCRGHEEIRVHSNFQLQSASRAVKVSGIIAQFPNRYTSMA